jgi:uncharacterized cofD-like protein
MKTDFNGASSQRPKGKFGKYTNWLIPGLGVKRWLVLVLMGTTFLGVGLGIGLLEIYRTAPDTWWLPALSWVSLRFLPRILRVIIFGSLGLGVVVFAIWGLNRAIISPFVHPGDDVGDTLRTHRQRGRGPRVVAIGGGHGLATLLRGLKEYSHNITAIVTVADDGGSSGRLRQELGILPPGDIRNCLAALSSDEALLAQLFQYRFPDGDQGQEGHSFGNLFITAMAEITGSFEAAVAESGRVLAVQGQVLPSTLNDVRLQADVMMPQAATEIRIKGESLIPKSNGKVKRVWLDPSGPAAFPQSIRAILAADLIVIGPGSLFTSLLPNLLVPDLAEAIRASRALKLFVCNLATEKGETIGYTCGDHIRTILDHVQGGLFDITVANNRFEGNLPSTIDWVRPEPGVEEQYPVYQADLVDDLYPWRHDSHKLAQVIINLYQERTGPLV